MDNLEEVSGLPNFHPAGTRLFCDIVCLLCGHYDLLITFNMRRKLTPSYLISGPEKFRRVRLLLEQEKWQKRTGKYMPIAVLDAEESN
jgi:hypothetical protein